MAANPRLVGIAPSLIRAVAARRRPTSIDLGLGEPTLRPPQAPLEAATAWVAAHGCPYTPNAGDPELRAAIAAAYAYPGMGGPEHVCVTNGSQEALHAVFASLLDPSLDEALVVEPAFGAYAKLAELAGVRARTVAMDPEEGFAFDADRILAAVDARTRLIALCSPCNPTGRVLPRAQGERLAAGLLARPDPPLVLFDEVYRELTFAGEPFSLAEVYPRTVVVNSLSKSHALTGLRLGWAIGPAAEIALVVKAHAWTSSTASTYAQRVASALFADPTSLCAHRAWYVERAAATRALLARRGFAHAPTEGTFYAFVRVPGMADSVAAAVALAEEDDVLAIPGRAFGASGEGWLRLSCVAPLDRVDEGLARMRRRFAAAR